MFDVTDYPSVLFVVSAPFLWGAAWLGTRLGRRFPLDDDMRQDFGTLQAAALTLLALIIGFSFSMAAGRYDQRKNLEESEANAIGTQYARASLLPAADAAKLRSLLKDYLDHRIRYYTAYRESSTGSISRQTAKLQDELWSAVLAPAAANPTPIMALVVSGMNDVLNAQSYTQAAWWNRIPDSAWALMIVIAFLCNMLVGYGARSSATAKRLIFIFPVFVAIGFGFIADIDAPRHGIIRIGPQNLMNLAGTLPSQ
ncbi:MAG: hypothetical protein KIS73_06415 [Enhydrobacter sp.]|nr:hypothetical protein [Enhydrobacter sp.]